MEFFDCPNHQRCKVFLNFTQGMGFNPGWLYFDTLVVAMLKRGPFIYCKMTKQKYPEIAKLLDD